MMRWDEVIARIPSHNATLVEVGVWRGAFAEQVLRARPEMALVLVDPWLSGEHNPNWLSSGAVLARHTQPEMDAIYQSVLETVRPHGARVRVLRMTSLAAAAQVADGSCDAVFIDADHSCDAVTADILAWLPKVRSGGWIGGHDYDCPRFPGVKAAVDALLINVEQGRDRTWFAPVGRSS